MANLTCSTRAAAHNTTQLSVRRSSSANSTSPDNSLTSLNWLQSIKVPDLYAEEVTPQFLAPISPSSSDVFSSTNESDKEPEREECSISLSPLRRCLMQIVEYRKNPYQYLNDPTKPPLSYTTLIFLAIQSSNKEKVMLGEIYQWIRENFKYYRVTESTWQNSVRHNLSLNDFFMKIPRSEYDAGKGSFWKINPEYEQILNTEGELHCFDQNHLKLHVARVKAKSRKRSQSTSNGHGNQRKISSRMRKRARSQCSPPTADPCYLPGDLDWISLLSSQRVNCKSCPDGHSCRPSFGSPVLGPPDLGHIGEPLICSPAMIPHGLATQVPDTPPSLPATITSSSISLEELVTTSDSSPLLPPWNRSRDHSPISLDHPWAESRDSITQHLQTLGRSKGHHWSPEGTWSMATTTIHGISPTPPYHPKLHC